MSFDTTKYPTLAQAETVQALRALPKENCLRSAMSCASIY